MTLVLVWNASPAAGQATDDSWQFGTSPSFSSGTYGTDTRTDVLHTPVIARRLFADGDVTLLFPFTCIAGNGTVTIVNGAPVRTTQDDRRSQTDATTSRSLDGNRSRGTNPTPESGRRAGELAPEPVPATFGPRVNTCGMGDIVVRGRYYVVDERGWLPTIAVRAHVKAPTARADRGLGTGRPDEGIGLELSRTLAGNVLAMVDGGYTVVGKPTDVHFNNTWWYDVGLGRALANGVVTLSVFYEEYSALVPGLASARDVLAAVNLRGGSGWRIQMSGQFGLSEGAPDHGFALGASRRF